MMLLRHRAMSRILLVRPGATEFDEQGRIKGSLDIPLSQSGKRQADSVASELSEVRVRTIYTSPCQSAQETAQRLARGRDVRVRVIEGLRNIDHGLWHGKLIDEVRRNQPRVYRRGQEAPSEFCAPQGESIRDAQHRLLKTLRKLIRGGGEQAVALVIPDPLATLAESYLRGEQLRDLWKAETDTGTWTMIEAAVQ